MTNCPRCQTALVFSGNAPRCPKCGGARTGEKPQARPPINLTELGRVFKADPKKGRQMAKDAGIKIDE
jgi:hypothetical protein